MATHKGSEGVVKVGANTIAELKSYSIEETANTIDTTTLGDSSETHVTGLKKWSGSADCFWDETDTNGQLALTIGSSVTMNFYPEGATTGDRYATGTATVVGASVNAESDGIVETSFSFTGTGDLTWGAAS
jgi:hypothetical protein